MKASIVFCMILFATLTNARANAATALLFNGTGASPTDVVALANILSSMGISYDTASSAQINSMTRTKLASYKLIVWPGGNSIDMGYSLTTKATAAIRTAVTQDGVAYIGFCAGAFMAESSTLYNVFNLTGIWFDFYKPGLIDIVRVTFANGRRRDLVFWDGPHVDRFGTVIAKYPNGQSAIAGAKVGKGFVIVSGVHPEAPGEWRYGFATPDSDGVAADIDLTKSLITSALNKRLLASY